MLVILCLLFIGVLSQREGHWKSVEFRANGVIRILSKKKSKKKKGTTFCNLSQFLKLQSKITKVYFAIILK